MNLLAEYAELLNERDEYYKYNQIELYQPYPWQTAFHRCPRGLITRPFEIPPDAPVAPVRTLLTGNKMGKTFVGASEVSYHLTGNYPADWQGMRFDHPVEVLVAGVNNDKTRDICQKFLFGEPTDPNALGTGSVPKHLIGESTRKPGVPNAYDNVLVKHRTGGWSKCMFQAYEQKKGSFMGIPVDVGWLDEEPPLDVYNQFVRGVIAKKKYTILLTFTAENGGTDLVYKTLHDLGKNQGLVRAGWADTPHIIEVPGKVEELRSLFPSYEWKMRENGDPVVGTGRVFQIAEEAISIAPIEIPAHWKRIIGIDFGMEHPFVACWLAHDTDNDICYVHDIFSRSDMSIPDMCSILKRHGRIPVAWPHDMAKRAPGVPEGGSGTTIKQLFEQEGVLMLEDCFSNPPDPGKRESKSNNSVSAGIMAMQNAFNVGTLRVFDTLTDWFTEFRNYHTQDGKIVKSHDDRMDATRYAFQSRRFARLVNQRFGGGRPIQSKCTWPGLH